ncbi:MAG: hypothetical protein NTY66_02360, partial [Candidatus Vogelbacteria bacterium]|nr:hypothetical protein [Candidatus Vogelbacteria bacterium]
MPPEPTNPTDLAAARERARLAMGGVERATKEAEKSKVTDERRQAAALAMEGSERRQRREAKEHELKEKQDMLKRIDEEVKRREAEVEKKRQEAEAAKKNQVAMREQEIKQKEDAFTASRSVIEKLKEERGSTLHAIHTLQSDLAEAVQAENISTEKIIIAEQEKVPSGNAYVLPENSGLSYRRLTIYLLIIIIALGGGTGYWYFKQKQATPVVVPVTVASIIFAEKNLEVNSSKIVRGEAVGKISAFLTSGTSQNEEIGNIYFTKEIANANALTQKDVLIFPEWQKYTESTIPEDFSRFVSQYMVGAYLYGSSSSLFLV